MSCLKKALNVFYLPRTDSTGSRRPSVASELQFNLFNLTQEEDEFDDVFEDDGKYINLD